MAGLNLEAPTAGRDAAAGRRLAVWPIVLVAVLLAGLLAGNHLLATERSRGAARVQVDRSAADLADFARTWKPAKGASTSSVEGFLRAALGRDPTLPSGQRHLAFVGHQQLTTTGRVPTVATAFSAAVRALPAGTAHVRYLEIDTPDGRFVTALVPVVADDPALPGTYVIAQHVEPALAAQEAVLRQQTTLGLGALAALAVLGWAAGRLIRRRRSRSERAPQRAPGVGTALSVVVTEGFLSRLAFGLLSFALPLYAHHLGMSLPAIGLLLSTNMAVAAVLKPAMGWVVDHLGVRRAYVVAVALRAVVLLTLVVASSPAHLFLARAAHGVSIALRDPASATVLAGLGGKQAVAQRFAWYQTAKTVAGSVGQFAAGALITLLAGGYAVVFGIAAAISVLPLVLVVWLLRGPLVDALRLPQPERRQPLSAGLRATLLPYAGLGLAMTGTAYLMANLLPVMTVEYMGLPAVAASSMYLMTAVISVSGPAWGWIADRLSLRLVLGVRAVGNVVSSLVWLVFPGYPGLLVGKGFDDVGKAAFRPAWGAVMAGVAALDPPRRARSLAWMSSAEDAGEMAGPVIAGLIWSAFGLPALLLTRAGLGVAAELYAWWIGRRGPRITDQAERSSAP